MTTQKMRGLAWSDIINAERRARNRRIAATAGWVALYFAVLVAAGAFVASWFH